MFIFCQNSYGDGQSNVSVTVVNKIIAPKASIILSVHLVHLVLLATELSLLTFKRHII